MSILSDRGFTEAEIAIVSSAGTGYLKKIEEIYSVGPQDPLVKEAVIAFARCTRLQ